MAIVKASYTRTRAGAKQSVRYIAHRPGRDGARITRQLWGADGAIERVQGYQLIDQAAPGSVYFRLIVSPDPRLEDGTRDLHLRAVTERVMAAVGDRTGKQVNWLAATHDDHTANRHVHVVAVVQGRLDRDDLQHLTAEATAECVQQRAERDAALEARQQLEQEADLEWELER